MRLRDIALLGISAAVWLLSLTNGGLAAGTYSPGVGLADPAIGMNAGTYGKWGRSSAVPFIDRMKGALNWSGQLPSYNRDEGSVRVLKKAAIFKGKSPLIESSLGPDTLIDLNRLLVVVAYQKKLISRAENQRIADDPDLFFKLEPGPGGASLLSGRLREADAFAPLVQFDRDIGMSLAQLRESGHLHLTNTDKQVSIANLALDKNGWPTRMPVDLAGGEGQISTTVMWYPRSTAEAPDSIYAGRFYLLADGKGRLSLTQKGAGEQVVSLKDIEIDGPSAIPFDYQPNGKQVRLTLIETDPDGTGEYLRNIRILHERHLPLFQAGEIFTPEFVEFMADFRMVRWMQPMETPRNPSFFAGTFAARPKLDFYSFNLGTNDTELTGIPIDAIIAFANKTGTDPWITPSVNISDEFARGLAAYVAKELDPDLTLYVELGNENWNGIFPTFRHSARAAIERWGELQLSKTADGALQITQEGRFASNRTLQQSGFATLPALTKALSLPTQLLPMNRRWAEWSGMRATQIGRIFEDAFAAADPATAKRRLNNIMGAFSAWADTTDTLMQTVAWREEQPEAWIDPAVVFETLAIGAYFGGTLGSWNSDLVTHWIETMGEAGARERVLRHLKAGLDPAQPLIRLGPSVLAAPSEANPDPVPRGVAYRQDLMVDLTELLQFLHPEIRERIRSGAGVKQKRPVMAAAEAAQYLRLAEEAGNTALQVRTGDGEGSFKTVLVFEGKVPQSLPQMLAEEVIVPRSLYSLKQEADRYFTQQGALAKKYGLDLVAYEGGQHLAAALWGIYRANLQNKPLVSLLRNLNQDPEIADLYRVWFDAWREAGGGLFVHYADIGFPSRYGSWGVISYLGHEKVPGNPAYRLNALRHQNAKAPWWTEERAADAFLHGLWKVAGGTLTGTAKADVLVATGSQNHLDGGPGDDALVGISGANTFDGGDGNDIIVIAAQSAVVDGGPGKDTVKPALGMAAFDLSALNAANIEVIDTRNASRTAVSIKPADVHRLTGGDHLAIFAETRDRISMPGFQKSGTDEGPDGFTALYQARDGGRTVTLSVSTDTPVR